MYHVCVLLEQSLDIIHRCDFAFGDWAEIGWWLDDSGYNSPGYRVHITFD